MWRQLVTRYKSKNWRRKPSKTRGEINQYEQPMKGKNAMKSLYTSQSIYVTTTYKRTFLNETLILVKAYFSAIFIVSHKEILLSMETRNIWLQNLRVGMNEFYRIYCFYLIFGFYLRSIYEFYRIDGFYGIHGLHRIYGFYGIHGFYRNYWFYGISGFYMIYSFYRIYSFYGITEF